jgi:hypothetical protein
VLARRDQASVSTGIACGLALAVLAGGAAMLAWRTQPVGVAFMILYAGASLFALFVLMRSETGAAPRLVLAPLLVASIFAMVIAGDPFGYAPTTKRLADVAAASPPRDPDPVAPDADAEPRSDADVVAAVAKRTSAGPGPQVRMQAVAVAGGGTAVEWSLDNGTGELPCGQVTLFGADRRRQVELLTAMVARARRESRDVLSCGDATQNAQADAAAAQGDRDQP